VGAAREHRLHYGRATGGDGIARDEIALLGHLVVLRGDPLAGQALEAIEAGRRAAALWRLGGSQIDYADEQPMVRQMFAEALARHGLSSRMAPVYEAEVPNLPPKAA